MTLLSLMGGRWYGEREPTEKEWPWGRVGYIIPAPERSAFSPGMSATFAVSAFARSGDAGLLYTINDAVVASLDDRSGDIGDGVTLRALEWVTTDNSTEDSNAGAYRSIIQFNAITGA